MVLLISYNKYIYYYLHKESHRHLKMDFKDELGISSHVARHCTTWALSDSQEARFANSCDHKHDEFCAEVTYSYHSIFYTDNILLCSVKLELAV